MPADLFMTNGKANMVYAKTEVPWHKCGTPFDPALGISAVEAMEMAGTDYRVHKCPTVTRLPDGTELPAKEFALMREPVPGDPVWRQFGTAAPQYRVLQNREVAEILDSTGVVGVWPLETHGALGKGERVFTALKAGTFQVAGEEVEQYLTVLDDKTGHAALKFTIAAVRVVCSNTWASNEASAHITATIAHRSAIHDDLAFRLMLVRQVQEAQRGLVEACEQIAATKVTDGDVDLLVQSLFPLPKGNSKLELSKAIDPDSIGATVFKQIMGNTVEMKRLHEQAVEVVGRHRAGVKTHFAQINDTYPAIAGTGWALFNGVTGYIDHDAPRRGSERRQAEDLAFGKKAALKARAFSEILTIGAN